jgi:hypothetical protein
MDVHFVSDDGIQQHRVGELEQLLARDDGLVWVDMPVCDQEAARVLSEVFGFHPLAVQACIERNAVPKVRAYRDHIFVISSPRARRPTAWKLSSGLRASKRRVVASDRPTRWGMCHPSGAPLAGSALR